MCCRVSNIKYICLPLILQGECVMYPYIGTASYTGSIITTSSRQWACFRVWVSCTRDPSCYFISMPVECTTQEEGKIGKDIQFKISKGRVWVPAETHTPASTWVWSTTNRIQRNCFGSCPKLFDICKRKRTWSLCPFRSGHSGMVRRVLLLIRLNLPPCHHGMNWRNGFWPSRKFSI